MVERACSSSGKFLRYLEARIQKPSLNMPHGWQGPSTLPLPKGGKSAGAGIEFRSGTPVWGINIPTTRPTAYLAVNNCMCLITPVSLGYLQHSLRVIITSKLTIRRYFIQYLNTARGKEDLYRRGWIPHWHISYCSLLRVEG